tara:strand:- start:1653 stop:1922 length:270 start_codon:yes stop_codon:yes gene_type:complete
MKIRFNKTDKAYFWFTQAYQCKFAFEVQSGPYEHCNKLFDKWWKLEGSSLDEDCFVEFAWDFLEKEKNMWLDDLEAGWAVGDLLNSSKN